MADERDPTPSQSGTFEYSEAERARIMLKDSLFDEVETPDYRDIDGITQQLYKLHERETKQYLHAVTLSDYLRKKIIPRGLRLQKAPALGLDNPDFCQRWTEILNKCSFDLMALAINELNEQLEKTRAEVKQLDVQLNKELADRKKLTELKKDIEQYAAQCSNEIRTRKKVKFARDMDDYKQKKVYFWRDGKPEQRERQHRDNTRYGSRGYRQQPSQHYRGWPSSSSLESGSDTSSQSASVERSPSRHKRCRRGQRKKAKVSEVCRKQTVINLSDKVLSEPCISALNKGLNFAPTSQTNDFETFIDFQTAARGRYDQVTQEECLQPRKKAPTSNSSMCCVRYSPLGSKFRGIIQKHWHIVNSDPRLKNVFTDPPKLIFKRPNNIRDGLVRSDTNPQNPPKPLSLPDGNYKCGGCSQCVYTQRCKTFTHPHTGRNISIRGVITCSTTHVIYMIRCPCGLAYIGKTSRELRTRISEHRSKIRSGDERSPVAAHFKKAGHNVSALRYLGVEGIVRQRRGGDLERRLLQRETFWIYSLNTLSPNGLNEDFDIRPFL